MKIKEIITDQSSYALPLTEIAKPPKSLYYIGNLPDSRCPTVAIVGSRKPTAYGREVTALFAHTLAKHGIIIISGLALGVDGIAHRACLEAGGTTLAVLGNGLSTVYPRSHHTLHEHIIYSGGAIVSEYEPNTPPRPFRFLERNRLVSGLADVILITEASSRSGTLSTAMQALDQNKDLFVVPGPITSPLSSGCNQLLKEGASPALDPRDILALFETTHPNEQQHLPLGDTPAQQTIITLISQGIRDGETLHLASQLDARTFSQELTMLELSGTIVALGNNHWRLR